MSLDRGKTPAPENAWARVFMAPRWPVWQIPSRVLGPVLLVELTAVLLVSTQVYDHALPGIADLRTAGILLAAGLVHTEIAVRIERVRRRIGEAVHVDFTSVWTFAGVLLLPPTLAVALAVVLMLHLWRRAWYPRVPLFRHVFTIATIVLACLASRAAMESVGVSGLDSSVSGALQLTAVILAGLVYFTVNSGLVAGAVLANTPQPNIAAALGDWDENLLEIATLCLGALTAIVMITVPVLAPLGLPALLLLHRAALVRHLEQAANTDSKTGLLNAAAWHTRAERELRRAPHNNAWAVLVVDLDHFKAVNDTHGHLAGDLVLAAVADALRDEVRDRDLVGRFGGEEFVVLLAGNDHRGSATVEVVADRIRLRIAALRVEVETPDGPLTIAGFTASIGGAVYPGNGDDLRSLMLAADTALYAGKRSGRDVVVMSTQIRVPSPADSHTGL